MVERLEWDSLWINANLATMEGSKGIGVLMDAALAVKGGEIVWRGAMSALPGKPYELAEKVKDVAGAWMTPGLVDCHTHIVHGGNRAREFSLRLEGASYEEIAKAGGGIVSTVSATRQASEEDLLRTALLRVDRLLAEGVTTLEIKSGYGLDLETERKMLKVAREIGRQRAVTVSTSFLGAHALPKEYEGRADDYITFVCEEVLPTLAADGLIDVVDGFCETIGFTLAQTERLFEAAKGLGLPVKLHAEQLSDSGGAELTARFGGLSADHLEYLSAEGIAAMAEAGTVAVLLPGAFYCLRETKLPPIQALRDAGVPIALATDCNPGSAPVTSLLLMLSMGCTFFRLTTDEVLRCVTVEGAKALGLDDRGKLAVGQRADLCIWQVEDLAELAYRVAFNPLSTRVVAGQEVSA